MKTIVTIEEDVEYLINCGFKASRGDWGMGPSLFAFVGESEVDGLLISKFGLYAYQENDKWFVFCGYGQTLDFPNLHLAVMLMEEKLRMKIIIGS